MPDDIHSTPIPDLNTLAPAMRAYIEMLQAENRSLRTELEQTRGVRRVERAAAPRVSAPRPSAAEPEPLNLPAIQYSPATMLISISGQGMVKRTPLNAYGKQRRGGMGVYDIKLKDDDAPAFLLIALESETLLVVTSRCRAYRVPVSSLHLGEVRDRGDGLAERLRLTEGEKISAVLAVNDANENDRPWVLLGTATGAVRRMRRNFVGPNLADGTILYDPKDGGPPTVMCLSRGDGDLFLASNTGLGIRFEEKLVSHRGTRGIRLTPQERLVGMAPLPADGSVLLVSADGQGVFRPMESFAASKSAGGQGKIAIKTDSLVAGLPVRAADEVLCISAFAKLIRFDAAEVPPRTSVAQGVNVMELRGDRVTAVTVCTPPG